MDVVPALIADLGEQAAWRYVEFSTADIRTPNTRRACARACNRFFAWCRDDDLPPAVIRPHNVAEYIEELQHRVSAPSVKQHATCKVEDRRPRGAGWSVRLREKGGKRHTMPCHHAWQRRYART
jgi:hypothetical protein